MILEYRGGTYASQVGATGPQEALRRWAKSEKLLEVKHLGPIRRQRLAEQIDEELREFPPVPLQGLVNAWCARTPIPGGLIHLIKTENQHSVRSSQGQDKSRA